MTTCASNSRTITPAPNIVGAPLIRAHAVDLCDDFASLAISLREALWRNSDNLASIHAEQIKLVWREIARSFNELQKIERAQ